MPFIDAPGDNFITPDRIRRDAADAELVIVIARWMIDHWDYISAVHRSAFIDAVVSGGQAMMLNVPMRPLLEALTALTR
jgi:hypothetical protein